MSIPDLNIKIIRFLASFYGCFFVEKYIYQDFGKYIKITLSDLNEGINFFELFKKINELEDRELTNFYTILCNNGFSKNEKKFKQELKANILFFICKELGIKLPDNTKKD